MSEIKQNNQEEIKMEEINNDSKTTENGSKTNEVSDGVVVREELEKAEESKLTTLESKLENKIEPVKRKPGPKPKTPQQSTVEKKEETNITEEVEEKVEKKPEESKSEESVDEIVVVKQRNTNIVKHQTLHNFEPDDKVYVAEFKNVRETAGYTRLENQFKFVPVSGEIEKIFITKESGIKCIRYKLKNKAGSMFDEEDVCSTIDECIGLCDLKNRRG